VSIDQFRWIPYMLENTLEYAIKGLSASQRSRLTPYQLHPKVNDSFFPFFQMYTEPLKDSIEAVEASLETYQWCGEPIDVLMIDAAKSWDALDQIVRQFFPCLVDGAAVIHQDYKHAFTYWLHPVTERMLERGVLTVAENVHGLPTQGFRFRKTSDFRIDDYLSSAFSSADTDRLLDLSVARFCGEEERIAVIGAKCQMLKDRGQIGRAKAAFEQAVSDGGFADNYPLGDLLMIARDWARPLVSILLETAITRANNVRVKSGLRAVGSRCVSIPAFVRGQSVVVDVPALDTMGCSALALNFRADTCSTDALRIRIEASDSPSATPFYCEEFSMQPGGYQPVVVPLAGRSQIALRWTPSSEGPSRVSREIHCIAPMLFLQT
jgi:hypothetical protein